MLTALRMRYREVLEEDNLRGLILTGREGLFSGGLDLPFLVTLPRDKLADWFRAFIDTIRLMATTKLLTIAAVSGTSSNLPPS